MPARAVSILGVIHQADPENVQYRTDLANALLGSAGVFEATGQLAEALGSRQARLPLLRRMARDRPDDPTVSADLARETQAIERLSGPASPGPATSARRD